MQGIMEYDVDINGVKCTYIQGVYEKSDQAIVYYHGYTKCLKDSLFRARLMASLGYNVLVYEQMGHGTRKEELKLDFKNPDMNFFKVVVSSITESPNVISFLAEKEKIHPNKIIFMGHSMGAMVAAGAFVKNPCGKLVAWNGCLNFEKLCDYYEQKYNLNPEDLAEVKSKIKYYSPFEFLSKLENRPILMVDGDSDESVPAKFNIETSKVLLPFYKDKTLFSHIVLENTMHGVTITHFEKMHQFLNRKSVLNYGI